VIAFADDKPVPVKVRLEEELLVELSELSTTDLVW